MTSPVSEASRHGHEFSFTPDNFGHELTHLVEHMLENLDFYSLEGLEGYVPKIASAATWFITLNSLEPNTAKLQPPADPKKDKAEAELAQNQNEGIVQMEGSLSIVRNEMLTDFQTERSTRLGKFRQSIPDKALEYEKSIFGKKPTKDTAVRRSLIGGQLYKTFDDLLGEGMYFYNGKAYAIGDEAKAEYTPEMQAELKHLEDYGFEWMLDGITDEDPGGLIGKLHRLENLTHRIRPWIELGKLAVNRRRIATRKGVSSEIGEILGSVVSYLRDLGNHMLELRIVTLAMSAQSDPTLTDEKREDIKKRLREVLDEQCHTATNWIEDTNYKDSFADQIKLLFGKSAPHLLADLDSE